MSHPEEVKIYLYPDFVETDLLVLPLPPHQILSFRTTLKCLTVPLNDKLFLVLFYPMNANNGNGRGLN